MFNKNFDFERIKIPLKNSYSRSLRIVCLELKIFGKFKCYNQTIIVQAQRESSKNNNKVRKQLITLMYILKKIIGTETALIEFCVFINV